MLKCLWQLAVVPGFEGDLDSAKPTEQPKRKMMIASKMKRFSCRIVMALVVRSCFLRVLTNLDCLISEASYQKKHVIFNAIFPLNCQEC
jgi:hypothetical protein